MNDTIDPDARHCADCGNKHDCSGFFCETCKNPSRDCLGNIMPANLNAGEIETWNLCAHAAKCGNTAGILGLSILTELRLTARVRQLEVERLRLPTEGQFLNARALAEAACLALELPYSETVPLNITDAIADLRKPRNPLPTRMAEKMEVWTTGREDMQSYTADGGESFASIYCDDGTGKLHLGQRLPSVVARVYGAECKSRARLLASAPDLFAALQDMAAGWRYIRQIHGDLSGVGWDRAEDAARAAIAKATGGES